MAIMNDIATNNPALIDSINISIGKDSYQKNEEEWPKQFLRW